RCRCSRYRSTPPSGRPSPTGTSLTCRQGTAAMKARAWSVVIGPGDGLGTPPSNLAELGREQADDHAEEGRGAVADLVVLEQPLVDEDLVVVVDPDRLEQAVDSLPGDARRLVDRAEGLDPIEGLLEAGGDVAHDSWSRTAPLVSDAELGGANAPMSGNGSPRRQGPPCRSTPSWT